MGNPNTTAINVRTIMSVQVSYDPAKDASNVNLRGLAFAMIERVDWTSALIDEDVRHDYGERRFRVLGFIDGRLHAFVFTPRAGKLHVISLRKANLREVKRHAKTTRT